MPTDDRTYVDVKTANAERELPLYPLLRRVLVEHRLASVWTAADDPMFAAGRLKPSGTETCGGRSRSL